jgi:anti-sigma regulatory factor (Ser/Thr protein kinase)
VPILLVARERALRDALANSAVSRFVPVHDDVEAALTALRDPPPRRRTEVELSPVAASSRIARAFVRSTCERWDLADHIQDATEVVTELVENAIVHAGTAMGLRLELRKGRLTVAVRDGSPHEAVLRERIDEPARGLHVVAELARVWGCAPDRNGGKVVWAVLNV